MRNKQKLILIISLILNFVFVSAGLYYKHRKNYTILDVTYKVLGIHIPKDYSLNEFYLSHASIYESCVKLHKKNQLVVFFGDSITHHAPWHEFFSNKIVINRGISGDDTSGLIKRLSAVTALLPKKIFLMIGTNDLWRMKSVDQIISNIVIILDELHIKSPASKIYIESLIPVRDNQDQDNEDIIKINAKLQVIAKKRGHPYIDLYTPLKDAQGYLAEEYTYDGLHLNGKGYEIWVDIVKNYVLDN